MASVYGSAPIEQAALQTFSAVPRPGACNIGTARSTRKRKWSGSRKNSVLLVVMTSISCTASDARPSASNSQAQYCFRLAMPVARRRLRSRPSIMVILVAGILMPL